MKPMKCSIALVITVVLMTILMPNNGYANQPTTILTPAEILAELTGKTVQEIELERTSQSKSYGLMAYEADVLDQFKEKCLENREIMLDQQVKNAVITKDQASQCMNHLKLNQSLCDLSKQNCNIKDCIGHHWENWENCCGHNNCPAIEMETENRHHHKHRAHNNSVNKHHGRKMRNRLY